MAELAGIQETPASAIQRARRVLQQAGADLAALDRFASVVDLLETQVPLSGNLVVDFGLARKLRECNPLFERVLIDKEDGHLLNCTFHRR